MTANSQQPTANLLNELIKLLATDDRLVIDGYLARNKVTELALNLDSNLLGLLLKNETVKKYFFSAVGDVLVFDKTKFQRFVNSKSFLPDSYTSYKNKIGLTSDGDYIGESKQVVLAWPYKDCVLEGGQDKEDAKRDEVFWSETLAPEQVDRLLSPKVLTGFKRFDRNGESSVTTIKRDAEINRQRGLSSDTITDNLLIKGNNLLALHSLKSELVERVKVIYIDPPYNIDNDSFQYNDGFDHSTWLTFIG